MLPGHLVVAVGVLGLQGGAEPLEFESWRLCQRLLQLQDEAGVVAVAERRLVVRRDGRRRRGRGSSMEGPVVILVITARGSGEEKNR